MLIGEKVDLRPVTVTDLDLLEAWSNDPAVESEYGTFGLQPSGRMQRAFAETGLLSDNGGSLIVAAKDGEIAGHVTYRRVAHGPWESSRAYQIGITLAPMHRGKGYGVEAQRLLTAYLFATYPVERVEAETDVTNVAEQHALAHAGFTPEGVLRRAQFRNGAWHDLMLYSKLRGE